MIVCQVIIANEYTRTGMFHKQMYDCLAYAFSNKSIRYLSASVTTRQAKQVCGFYPINYLLTDEFKFIPFSACIELGESKQANPASIPIEKISSPTTEA